MDRRPARKIMPTSMTCWTSRHRLYTHHHRSIGLCPSRCSRLLTCCSVSKALSPPTPFIRTPNPACLHPCDRTGHCSSLPLPNASHSVKDPLLHLDRRLRPISRTLLKCPCSMQVLPVKRLLVSRSGDNLPLDQCWLIHRPCVLAYVSLLSSSSRASAPMSCTRISHVKVRKKYAAHLLQKCKPMRQTC